MATFVSNCPHCSAHKMGFRIRGEYADTKNPQRRYVLGSCNACEAPLIALLYNTGSTNWEAAKLEGNLLSAANLKQQGLWPRPVQVAAPEAVPANVARNYVEAAEARQRGAWNAACATYRRTMELALKSFAPEVEAWKLEKRIDKLASEHRITADMQAWAHELRLDGNEALHGEEDATELMTEQMHHLTHFLLTYLYTLPQQIEEVRSRREGEQT